MVFEGGSRAQDFLIQQFAGKWQFHTVPEVSRPRVEGRIGKKIGVES